MVEAYTHHCPSTTHNLRHFSDRLPDFLAEHEPFHHYPTVSELARFERRLLDAFDAADADVITVSALAAVPIDQWPALTIRFHPSVQRFTSHWGAVECWQALKQDEPPPQVDTATARYWLLWRNAARITEFRCISALESELVHQALQGRAFSALCDTILEQLNEEDAGPFAVQALQSWIASGWVTRIGSLD